MTSSARTRPLRNRASTLPANAGVRAMRPASCKGQSLASLLVMLAGAFLSATPLARAQTPSGTVNVIVVDQSGGAMPNVALALVNANTALERRAVVDSEGRAVFAVVLPGRYTITAERSGFAPGRLTDIVVRAGDDLTLRVQLKVAGVSEVVNVGAGTTTYVAPVASTGTKTDTPLMETPLSVQVVPQQVLLDQSATTLDQALTNVSGVVSRAFGNGNEQIILRGFTMSTTLRDGFRIEDNTTGLRTLVDADSVEVLKGPAAILYGAIEPGGIVNIATKQPQASSAYRFEQRVGWWGESLTSLDATGPLTHDNTLLYRVNIAYDTGASWIDGVYNKKFVIAPALTWNMSARTQATVEAEYNHNPFIFDNVQALPYINGQFVQVPRNTNFGVTTPFTVNTTFVQFRLAHQFNDQWALRYQIGSNYASSKGVAPSLTNLQPSGNTFIASSYLNYADGAVNTKGTSLDVIGHFSTGAIKHTLLIGADYYHTDLPLSGYGDNVTYSIDVLNPVYPGTPPPGFYPSDPTYAVFAFDTTNADAGLYAQDQVELPQHVFATAGFRYDRLNTTGSSVINLPNLPFSSSTVNVPLDDSGITPRVGLLWKAQDWMSLYGNYAGNLSANAGSDYLGNPLKSSHARQYEAGMKVEGFQGKLRATLAYFDLNKTNVPTADSAHPDFQLLVGELGSKGAELDIQGQLRPNWNLILAYARTDTRVLQSNDSTCNSTGSFCAGDRFPNVPADTLSLWSVYEFTQGPASGLKVGGGVTGQASSTNANNLITYPGFAVVNAMTSYPFTLGGRRVIAQVNINNLFDKYYFTGNFSSGGATMYATVNPGAPRSVLASLKVLFR